MNTITFVGEHPKVFEVRGHTHETWELVYCTGGQGAFCLHDGSTITYRAGDLVAIPPKQTHSNASEEGFTNIHINILEPAFPCTHAFKLSDEADSLKHAFAEAKIYYASSRAKKELVLAALGDLIASYVVMFLSDNEFSEPVEQIRTSILENYTKADYALDEYIHRLPFHYDYLRKVFKKEVGKSPLEYLTSLRMKKAEQLLSTAWTQGRAVGEIAHLCGYENALYFSRVFKKYYNCSPSQFVKQQREIHGADPGRKEVQDL